ncbi:MAG: hypothetical protein ACPGJE_02865 [Wenzhouxiangellaceae bacterium]
MTTNRQAHNLTSVRDQRLSGDRRDFNLAYAAAFVLFLVVFTLALLLPKSWTAHGDQRSGGKGIIEQARAEANVLASCALMR